MNDFPSFCLVVHPKVWFWKVQKEVSLLNVQRYCFGTKGAQPLWCEYKVMLSWLCLSVIFTKEDVGGKETSDV